MPLARNVRVTFDGFDAVDAVPEAAAVPLVVPLVVTVGGGGGGGGGAQASVNASFCGGNILSGGEPNNLCQFVLLDPEQMAA